MKPNQEETAAPQKKDAGKNLQQWRETAAAQGLSGEWAVAARLGKNGFSEEEMQVVANLFGR